MLSQKPEFRTIAEVNPPTLPDSTHRRLEGSWSDVLITDNVFGKIRVSPYAFAARITHDVPSVHPTVVVSTRDRNHLAIESEVRGALGNGVDSFLVVPGDTFPAVARAAEHLDVVEHLRALQSAMPAFEVGLPTRLDRSQFRSRVSAGAQFLVTVPVLEPDPLGEALAAMELSTDDPPVFVAVIPPFSPTWVEKMAAWRALAGPDLAAKVAELEPAYRRQWAWEQVDAVRKVAEEGGAAGVVLMGLKFDTVVGEAAEALG